MSLFFMQYVKAPFFRQKTTYTCGPACLRMLFAFHDMLLPEEDIAAFVGANERRGTPDKAMLRLARMQGFSVKVSYRATWHAVESALERGMPVLIKYTEPSHNHRHYSVVVGSDAEEVILHDPWNGSEFRIARAEFLERWLGSAEKGKGWMMTIMLPEEEPSPMVSRPLIASVA